MRLKIVEYNVLNGFCSETKPFTLDRGRLNLACKLLEKERPDILVLTEAYFWPFAKKDSLGNYKALFESLCNLSIPAPTQFRWAPAVFSRFPIEFSDFSDYHKTFLRTEVRVGKRSLFLDVLHPYPELSEREKAELVDKALKDHGSPYILTGDLNALSPHDRYDSKRLVHGFRSFMKDRADSKIKDMLSCKSVGKILDAGLKDTYISKNSSFGYTVPTHLRSTSKDSAVRMDYIFCSDEFKILESGIIKKALTEKISDHYPVYAVLEI